MRHELRALASGSGGGHEQRPGQGMTTEGGKEQRRGRRLIQVEGVNIHRGNGDVVAMWWVAGGRSGANVLGESRIIRQLKGSRWEALPHRPTRRRLVVL